MSKTDQKYGLGTFSIAGGPSFAGLVIDNQVIAINALNQFKDELGGKVYGSSTMLDIIEDWDQNLPVIRKAAEVFNSKGLGESLRKTAVSIDSLRVHAPIENPRQMLMARANYRNHVIDLLAVMEEDKGDTLEERQERATRLIDENAANGEPMLFAKLVSTVTGPYDEIEIAATTEKADWELELAIIIGKPARNVSYDDALNYVAGYCMVNDVSNRDIHMRYDLGQSHDWTASKCSPGYMPMGPYWVPAENISDPHNLDLLLKYNGTVKQDGKSNDLIHNIPRLIEYASKHVQLMPGDIISTGSPAGNGHQEGISIQPGDVIESTITGLGVMKNTFLAPKK